MRKWFTIPSLVQLIITIGLIGFFLVQASTNSSELILQELQGQMLKQVSEELTQRLQDAMQLNQINYDSFQNRILNLNSITERERYFVSHFKSYPDVAMTYIGLADGSFYGARRTIDDEIQVVRNNALTGGASWYYSTSTLGEGVEVVDKFENYDPRKRPWYLKAEELKEPTFSSAYSHFVFREPTITYSYPVYDTEQQLVGVFGVDYLLSWLGETLRRLPIGDSGQVFVTDDSGNLIATSSNHQTFKIVDGTSKLILETEIEDPIIKAAIAIPESAYQDEIPKFKLGKEKYYVSYSKFDAYGVHWNIRVISAEDDFLSGFKEATSNTLIILSISILFSIFFTSWIAGRVTKPIINLSIAAEELTHGKFISLKDIKRNDELGKLTRSFNTMGTQLTTLVAHLEEEVASRTQELKDRNYELSLLSFPDGLTGIANRRKFDEVLEFAWQSALRYNRIVALLMLDIDFFKDYNDQYGHVAGDECLKEIGKLLRQKVRRSTDLAARYGGEEFVVLLQDIEIEKLMECAEEIRRGIEDLKIAHESSMFKVVTVSIGVAYLIPKAEMNGSQLIERADQMLYEAKNAGRNQVVIQKL